MKGRLAANFRIVIAFREGDRGTESGKPTKGTSNVSKVWPNTQNWSIWQNVNICEIWAVGTWMYSPLSSVYLSLCLKYFINYKENQQKRFIGKKGQWQMWFRQAPVLLHVCDLFLDWKRDGCSQFWPATACNNSQRKREASDMSPKSKESSFPEAPRKLGLQSHWPRVGYIVQSWTKPWDQENAESWSIPEERNYCLTL